MMGSMRKYHMNEAVPDGKSFELLREADKAPSLSCIHVLQGVFIYNMIIIIIIIISLHYISQHQ